MKIVKRILFIIMSIPVLIVVLFIVFEIFGMIVNHASTGIQTAKLEKAVKEIDDLEVIDTYSKTGNTSGTGNHVDMMTILIVQTDAGISSLKEALEDYADIDEYGFRIESLSDVIKAHEEHDYLYSIYDNLKIPEQDDGCYLIFCVNSAPFADNIQGH